MPPRYAYWTILVDDQPTAFRSGAKEDLLPTFNRLKEKQPTAVMKWFQNGKLWESRLDAQEAMHARGEMGRRGDERQAGFRSRDRGFGSSRPQGFKASRPEWKSKASGPSTFAKAPADKRDGGKRTAWTPRGEPSTPAPARNADEKLDWKPKGEFTPAPKRSEKPDWKPKASFDRGPKREWKPKASYDREPKREWKPKSQAPSPRSHEGGRKSPEKLDWKPKGAFTPAPKQSEKPDWKPKASYNRGEKREWKPKASRPEWTPKSQAPSPKSPEKRKWVPKADYKKSMGIEAKKDKNWRPGGEHKDPRQKYKDAKKAKWTKFKKTIRTKWEAKGKKKS